MLEVGLLDVRKGSEGLEAREEQRAFEENGDAFTNRLCTAEKSQFKGH